MFYFLPRVCIAVFFLVAISCSNAEEIDPLEVKTFPNRTQDFSLWQLGAFFEEVQMGYIIKSDDGKILVVDGGGELAAPILESFLLQLGGEVDTWILTHPHLDHVGAFIEIMDKGFIKTNKVLHVKLMDDWVRINEPNALELNKILNDTFLKYKILSVNVVRDDYFLLADGVEMFVFGSFNENLTTNAVNNSSMTFQIKSKSKSILFLGDLGPEGGRSLLELYDASQITSDYVQMAHHGQAGVNKEFYKAVNASFALWPTPKWLWENELEAKTLNYEIILVREWMSDLGIKRNIVSGLEGTIQID